uniref:(California timema) hypothetical protein n=1 Tax=Timema californicum TaxID=61474 RepID=A0A7R9J703_TIMCA|nr:unnamed protein product [Timema californicum]
MGASTNELALQSSQEMCLHLRTGREKSNLVKIPHHYTQLGFEPGSRPNGTRVKDPFPPCCEVARQEDVITKRCGSQGIFRDLRSSPPPFNPLLNHVTRAGHKRRVWRNRLISNGDQKDVKQNLVGKLTKRQALPDGFFSNWRSRTEVHIPSRCIEFGSPPPSLHANASWNSKVVWNPNAARHLKVARMSNASRHPKVAWHPKVARHPNAARHLKVAWRPKASRNPKAARHLKVAWHPKATWNPKAARHLKVAWRPKASRNPKFLRSVGQLTQREGGIDVHLLAERSHHLLSVVTVRENTRGGNQTVDRWTAEMAMQLIAVTHSRPDTDSISIGPWSVVHGPYSVFRGPWYLVRSPYSVVHDTWSVVRRRQEIDATDSYSSEQGINSKMFVCDMFDASDQGPDDDADDVSKHVVETDLMLQYKRSGFPAIDSKVSGSIPNASRFYVKQWVQNGVISES